MPIVTADEIRPLRRDAAFELALTRASGRPQTMAGPIGRLLTGVWRSSFALDLGPLDLVGQDADALALILHWHVPAVCAAADHHARHFPALRGQFVTPARAEELILLRFGWLVGDLTLLEQDPQHALAQAYDRAVRAVARVGDPGLGGHRPQTGVPAADRRRGHRPARTGVPDRG